MRTHNLKCQIPDCGKPATHMTMCHCIRCELKNSLANVINMSLSCEEHVKMAEDRYMQVQVESLDTIPDEVFEHLRQNFEGKVGLVLYVAGSPEEQERASHLIPMIDQMFGQEPLPMTVEGVRNTATGELMEGEVLPFYVPPFAKPPTTIN